MYDAIFKHRAKKAGERRARSTWSSRPKKARDQVRHRQGRVARVLLDGSEIIAAAARTTTSLIINDRDFEMPIPRQERTRRTRSGSRSGRPRELDARAGRLPPADRQGAEAAGDGRRALDRLGAARAGRLGPRSRRRSSTTASGTRRVNEYETEKQLRIAQAFGSLFFVLLGAPVGILFAKRDFLSAFISCFLPIIILYYPLMLLGVNLGKEGILNPIVALWVRERPRSASSPVLRACRRSSGIDVPSGRSVDPSTGGPRSGRGESADADPRPPALLGLPQGLRDLLHRAGRPLRRHRRLLELRRVHQAAPAASAEIFRDHGPVLPRPHEPSFTTGSAA